MGVRIVFGSAKADATTGRCMRSGRTGGGLAACWNAAMCSATSPARLSGAMWSKTGQNSRFCARDARGQQRRPRAAPVRGCGLRTDKRGTAQWRARSPICVGSAQQWRGTAGRTSAALPSSSGARRASGRTRRVGTSPVPCEAFGRTGIVTRHQSRDAGCGRLRRSRDGLAARRDRRRAAGESRTARRA